MLPRSMKRYAISTPSYLTSILEQHVTPAIPSASSISPRDFPWRLPRPQGRTLEERLLHAEPFFLLDAVLQLTQPKTAERFQPLLDSLARDLYRMNAAEYHAHAQQKLHPKSSLSERLLGIRKDTLPDELTGYSLITHAWQGISPEEREADRKLRKLYQNVTDWFDHVREAYEKGVQREMKEEHPDDEPPLASLLAALESSLFD